MSDLIKLIKSAALEAGEAVSPCGVVFGTVISANPLQIRIDQKLILPEEFLILTSAVRDCQVQMKNAGSTEIATMQVLNGLKKGETVLLLRVQGGQKYIVLDRG